MLESIKHMLYLARATRLECVKKLGILIPDMRTVVRNAPPNRCWWLKIIPNWNAGISILRGKFLECAWVEYTRQIIFRCVAVVNSLFNFLILIPLNYLNLMHQSLKTVRYRSYQYLDVLIVLDSVPLIAITLKKRPVVKLAPYAGHLEHCPYVPNEIKGDTRWIFAKNTREHIALSLDKLIYHNLVHQDLRFSPTLLLYRNKYIAYM